MFESFISSLGSKLFITLLLTSTVLTTGVAISKVSSSIASENIPNKGINIVAAENFEEINETAKEITPAKPFVASIVASVTKIPTIAKTFLPAATPTAKPTVTGTNTGCIITLSGQQFDVTSLRSSHSGGDIFNCGTDMTSVYNNKHGTSLSRMQKYLVATNGSGTPTVLPTSTQINMNNDDREDSEHEDRYVEKREKEDHNDDEVNDD